MPTGADALAMVGDWAALEHDEGSAADSPRLLIALLDADGWELTKAVEHLSTLGRAEQPHSATIPAALVAAGWLRDARVDRSQPPVRAAIVGFLCEVIKGEASRRPSFLGHEWGAIEPALFDPVLSALESDHAASRAAAVQGVVEVVAALELPSDRVGPIHAKIVATVNRVGDSEERRKLVTILGRSGDLSAPFLDDPAPGVRLAAALALAARGNEIAVLELLHAVEQHAEELGAALRGAVIQKLVAVVPPERLWRAGVALARARLTDAWGPILVAIFAKRPVEKVSPRERAFLWALIDDPPMWRSSDAGRWFARTGIPFDLEACTKLAGDRPR